LQPGGHRFDPGQLHQKIRLRVLGFGKVVSPENWKRSRRNGMESITSLGVFLVPIVAVIIGGVIAVTAMILKHHERIAKIERGIDPDGPQQR
jgi:hypothetical protein